MTRRVILLNGVETKDADTSAGHLLGLTCFETIAIVDGAALDLEAHLERLAGSAATLALEADGGLDRVRAGVDAAVRAYGGGAGILRVSLHARGHTRGLAVEAPGSDVLVVVGPSRYDDLTGGVAVVTATVRAPAPESWPAHVKAPCLPRTLAFREAQRRRAFEALLLDARGHVVSGSRSNLFARVADDLVTPPAPPALPGITRARVLQAAPDAGIAVVERFVHRDELAAADELFLTLTGPGIVPVTALDGAPVGHGGPGRAAATLAPHVPFV